MSQGLIQGIMREAPLPDIIQLMSQGGRTGCFHVVEESRRAKVYLKDGRIVHAVSQSGEGLEALYELALWLDGHYHFEETSGDIPVTITKTNAAVLMEMHRRMDEWRVISQKVTSLDLYAQSTLLPGETPQGASPRELKLLPLLTGFYTVNELAEVLQKPVLTIAKDIYGLVMTGHVMMKGVRSGRKPELPEGMAPAVEAPVVAAPPVAVAPVPVPEPQAIPVAAPSISEPVAEPNPASRASMGPVDPLRVTKLNAFAQRIVQAARGALPVEHHDLVLRLHAKATQQIALGEGPEAVKTLALSISRGAVDAGLDAETVKNLNAQLKALFNK